MLNDISQLRSQIEQDITSITSADNAEAFRLKHLVRKGSIAQLFDRLREVPKVEAIVEDEVDDFGRRYRELEVEPLLSELRKQAESIRARELERALDDLGNVDPAVAERMEHLSRTLVKRLLHDPTVRARERAGAGNADEVADAVRDLFGISPPSDR